MKVLIMLICFLFIATNLDARVIKLNRSGGGENGYDRVRETHEDGFLFFSRDKSTLTCHDPGYTSCDWNIHPSELDGMAGYVTKEEIDNLVGYAEDQITSGNNTGYEEEDIDVGRDAGAGKRILEWTSDGTIGNSTITISYLPLD